MNENENQVLTVVIIDDEKHGREVIKSFLLKNFPEIEIIGEADSVQSGKYLLSTISPKLVFLDIELNDGTSFDILQTINEINFEIIFVTAFNFYAIRAIKFSALDYLLKPVDEKELVFAIEKALIKLGTEQSNKHLNFLKEQIKKESPDKIMLPTGTGYTFISIQNIIRCEADSNYTKFHLANESPIMVSHTLKEYEELLSEHDFFRVHNSHLINMTHVSQYMKGKFPRLIMSDGSEVEISEKRKQVFLEHFAKL